MTRLTVQRYHRAAIILHWVMAVAFILMLFSGLTMETNWYSKSLRFQMYQWHKSLGVLLLIAFFLRVAIRFIKPHPELPAQMKPLEKKAAKLGHFALYGVMLAVPLSGWVMVSSSKLGLPTLVFGLFEWPHVPGVQGMKAIHSFAYESHELLAYGLIALIVLHVLAVIKHAVVDKENLLPRMGIGRQK
jgi:cytochrome b561